MLYAFLLGSYRSLHKIACKAQVPEVARNVQTYRGLEGQNAPDSDGGQFSDAGEFRGAGIVESKAITVQREQSAR
ncbi:hypothetical protein [Bartonella pachyuromydis]|uniref:Uncharacterized protein n=1 Tax=Bartonella pachyuromydis TaxID=931097 RepID=A0ABP8VMA3_9HYPH